MPERRPPLSLEPAARAARHRRQTLLHILLPVILTLVVVLAVAALSIVGTVQGSSEVNRWGNLSAVYLLIPSVLGNLLWIALTIILVRAVARLLRGTPGFMLRVQAFFRMLTQYARAISDRVASPVISTRMTTFRIRTFWEQIFRNPTSRGS